MNQLNYFISYNREIKVNKKKLASQNYRVFNQIQYNRQRDILVKLDTYTILYILFYGLLSYYLLVSISLVPENYLQIMKFLNKSLKYLKYKRNFYLKIIIKCKLNTGISIRLFLK